MATLGSKFVIKSMEWNANMTEQSHLGAALIAKPHVMMGKMDEIFSAKNIYSDNPLSSVLMGQQATEETIDTTEWEWHLKGVNQRPLVCVENVNDSTNTTLGKYRQSFALKLDENWFLPGDILSPGTSGQRYQARIIDNPVRHGDGWKYNVALITDDNNFFLPATYVGPGTQWAKLYSAYEEAAQQSGSTQFSFPITLKNRMSLLRKKYEITNYASTEVLAVAIPDSRGNYHKSWFKYAEVEYYMQWYREWERLYWYGLSSEYTMGANGRPVRLGPGIREQLEDSHIHRTTHLTAKLIEEYLMDIFYSRTSPGKGRHIKAYTGEYGMMIFHAAVQDWMQKNGFVKNVEMFTSKTSSTYHSNALQAGYQFTRYNMANGCSIELIHNPLYDDRTINFEIDPATGYPKESMRFTFLDFAGEGSKSNIQIKNKSNSQAMCYINGLYGPFGPQKGGNAAHAGSYYEMHIEKSSGIHIHDITKCGEIILDRN